jgi:hypothetical protein
MNAISRVSVVSASYEGNYNSKGVATTHEIKPANHLNVCPVTWWNKIQIDTLLEFETRGRRHVFYNRVQGHLNEVDDQRVRGEIGNAVAIGVVVETAIEIVDIELDRRRQPRHDA